MRAGSWEERHLCIHLLDEEQKGGCSRGSRRCTSALESCMTDDSMKRKEIIYDQPPCLFLNALYLDPIFVSS
jgi:hypothetical protein